MATQEDLIANPFPAGQSQRVGVFGTVTAKNLDEITAKLGLLYRTRPLVRMPETHVAALFESHTTKTAKEKDKIATMEKFIEKERKKREQEAAKATAEPKVEKKKVVKETKPSENVYVKPAVGARKGILPK